MRPIIIVYMPGHAGNFLTRLFSLSPETMPHLSKFKLQAVINGDIKLDEINRFESYQFSTAIKKFSTWQEFHRAYTDFADHNIVNLAYALSNLRFDAVVYANHPHEFFMFESYIGVADCYVVDLNLEKYQSWIDEQQMTLKFRNRPDEIDKFNQIKNQYPSINLTQILDSAAGFLDEYLRVCDLMKLTAQQESALALYQDWYSIRRPK